MNLQTLFSTPYPVHAFVLDPGRLAYGRITRRRDAFERTETHALHGGWCSLGPVGLLHVDRDALSRGIEEVVSRLEKRPQQASLVIPNAWLRSVIVDVGALPRQRQDAEDVIRWRLKKLLPCRPEDVRLDYLPTGDNGRVIVLLGLDRPFATIEECFAAASVQLGRLTPTALALTALLPTDGRPLLLAVIEDGTLALVAVMAGAIRLVRFKGLPAGDEQLASLIHRELGQTLAYLRDHTGAENVALHLVAASEVAVAAVTEWALDRPEVAVRRFPGAGEGGVAIGKDDLHAWLLLAAARERVG